MKDILFKGSGWREGGWRVETKLLQREWKEYEGCSEDRNGGSYELAGCDDERRFSGIEV